MSFVNEFIKWELVQNSFFLFLLIPLLLYWFSFRGVKSFPPGPRGWPIVGNIYQLGKEHHMKYMEWSKIYGNILGLQLGSFRTVVISDCQLIRKCFNEKGFNGRPNMDAFTCISGGKRGIIASDGYDSTEQRKFAVMQLKHFGFRGGTMESLIQEEVDQLIGNLAKEVNCPILLNDKLDLAILNSLWFILSGTRYRQDDPELNELLKTTNDTFNQISINQLAMYIPWVSKIAPGITGINKLYEAVSTVKQFYMDTIQKHDHNEDEGSAKNFIEAYLTKIKNTNDNQSSFFGENGRKSLVAVIGDFFSAGSDTTSATLLWAILYLTSNQNVQRKLQSEIDSEIGIDRQPCLSDRSNMTYTECVIDETLRLSSVVPLGAFHCTLEECRVGNYSVPKETLVLANLYGVHHDQQLWGDPEEFRPERFENAGLKAFLLPFSCGARTCVGEQFAKDQLFLFIVGIFQKFRISFPPLQNVSLKPHPGLLLVPKAFKVVLSQRLG